MLHVLLCRPIRLTGLAYFPMPFYGIGVQAEFLAGMPLYRGHEVANQPRHTLLPPVGVATYILGNSWRGDEDINTIVTPTTPVAIHTGPITRAHARQLNYQVLSFLGNDSNVHEIMMLPKLDTFVLLTNEGPSLEKDEHWSKNKHGDDAMRKGNKNRVTSDDFMILKPP